MATLTVYPEPGVTASGRASRESSSGSFASYRGGAGTNADDTSVTMQILSLLATTNSNEYERLVRGIILFDTSALPASPTITDAVFSLWVTAIGNQMSQSAGLVSSNPASNTGLVAGDFTTLGTTRFATDKTIGSLSTGAYNDYTLNASGIAAISDSGITKFGYRLSCDIDNSAPTWGSGQQARVNAATANQTGTDNDPKLVITYTVVSGPANLKTYNTNVAANIKSIDTNLIANVKTLDTNA